MLVLRRRRDIDRVIGFRHLLQVPQIALNDSQGILAAMRKALHVIKGELDRDMKHAGNMHGFNCAIMDRDALVGFET